MNDYTAYVADARGAFRLYESMRTEELLHLQAAFTLDQARATQPESVAFGAGRLALIAFVLKGRGVTPTADSAEIQEPGAPMIEVRAT